MTTKNITISLLLALVGCNTGDDPPDGESSSGLATDAGSSSSSEDESSSSDAGSSDDGSSSSDDGSEESSSTGEPVGCIDIEIVGAYEGCSQLGCVTECDAGMECRINYPGGYLAMCAPTCTVDADCPALGGGTPTCGSGVCGFACALDGDCPQDGAARWCYGASEGVAGTCLTMDVAQ